MPSDRRLELRVSRLENDRDSIYEILTEIKSTQQEHTVRLDKMDARLDKMDGRLDKIEVRLDKIEARLDEMDRRFDKIDARLDKIDTVLAEIMRRLPDPS